MTQSTISTVATNSANSEMGWSSVSLSNIHTIYDFNESIIAYSVDVTNNNTRQQGYELISSSPNDEPIMEFSKDSPSPYDAITNTNDTCVFSGVGGYYAKSNTNSDYYDIHNKKNLAADVVNAIKNVDAQKKYASPDIKKSQKERTDLSNSKLLKSAAAFSSTNEMVLDVPIYTQNDESCAPTAAAMALKYLYPSNLPQNKTAIVDELKSTMQWNYWAATLGVPSVLYDNIPSGMITAMQNWGVSSFGGSDCYNTSVGRSYATFDRVTINIASGLPLLITDQDSKITYPNHSMCIVGYQGNSYIIVHDTWGHNGIPDGNKYINYYSSTDIGNNFGFTLL